jgi:hypothetical protein
MTMLTPLIAAAAFVAAAPSAITMEDLADKYAAETEVERAAACAPTGPAIGLAICYGLDHSGAVLTHVYAADGTFTPYSAVITPAVAPTTTIAAEPTTSVAAPVAAAGSFGDGTWLVGTDIQPGTYRADGMVADGNSADWCYWGRLSDLTGGSEADDNGIIDNHLGTDPGQVVVEILPTDVAFETNDCGIWTPV